MHERGGLQGVANRSRAKNARASRRSLLWTSGSIWSRACSLPRFQSSSSCVATVGASPASMTGFQTRVG